MVTISLSSTGALVSAPNSQFPKLADNLALRILRGQPKINHGGAIETDKTSTAHNPRPSVTPVRSANFRAEQP